MLFKKFHVTNLFISILELVQTWCSIPYSMQTICNLKGSITLCDLWFSQIAQYNCTSPTIFLKQFLWLLLQIFWGTYRKQEQDSLKLHMPNTDSSWTKQHRNFLTYSAMTLSKATDNISRSVQSNHKTIFSLCLREGRTLCYSWNLAYTRRQQAWEISKCHNLTWGWATGDAEWPVTRNFAQLHWELRKKLINYPRHCDSEESSLFHLNLQTWILAWSTNHSSHHKIWYLSICIFLKSLCM